MFTLRNENMDRLWSTYKILVGRILIKHVPALKWMSRFLPSHIQHEYTDQMSKKSKIHPLPIQFRNETKHEDCVAILNTYEATLIDVYTKAFG